MDSNIPIPPPPISLVTDSNEKADVKEEKIDQNIALSALVNKISLIW